MKKVNMVFKSEPWISVEDAAKYVGVKAETIRSWIKNKNMPAVKVGKQWRLKISEIDSWLQSGQASDSVD